MFAWSDTDDGTKQGALSQLKVYNSLLNYAEFNLYNNLIIQRLLAYTFTYVCSSSLLEWIILLFISILYPGILHFKGMLYQNGDFLKLIYWWDDM